MMGKLYSILGVSSFKIFLKMWTIFKAFIEFVTILLQCLKICF